MKQNKIIDLNVAQDNAGSKILVGLDKTITPNPLPWLNPLDWGAVYASLEMFSNGALPPSNILKRGIRKLLFDKSGRLLADACEKIGCELFQNALKGGPGIELSRRIGTSQAKNVILALNLQEADSYLHAYPWEILHDGHSFLFLSGGVQLVRCIDIKRAPEKNEPLSALGVLFVNPHPKLSKNLPSYKSLDRRVFRDLANHYPDDLHIFFLYNGPTKSTLQKIVERLNTTKGVQIVHIDTHGGYGWLCRSCETLNPEQYNRCTECSKLKDKEDKSKGYLAFMKNDGRVDWVSGEGLGYILKNHGLSMVVLSACQSGLVGGGNSYHSVAGALIHHGIPAVIAMQYSVRAGAAKEFSQALYQNLLESKKPWTEAVAVARLILYSCAKDHWYRPVFYLNTSSAHINQMFFTRAIPRSSDMKVVEDWIDRIIQRDSKAKRVLRWTAPDGQGKSTLLTVIGSRYQQKAFVYNLLAESIPEQGGFNRAFPSFIQELTEQVSQKYHRILKPKAKLGQQEIFTRLVRFICVRADMFLLLIDDYDKLTDVNRQALEQQILIPLLNIPNTGIIQTTTFVPPRDRDNRLLQEEVITRELLAPNSQDIAHALGPAGELVAQRINRLAGGNTLAASRIVSLYPAIEKPAKALPRLKDEELVRVPFTDEGDRKILLGDEQVTRNVTWILSVLRWFDFPVAARLIPIAMRRVMQEDYSQTLSTLDIRALLIDLDDHISWENGKYAIFDSYRTVILNYLMIGERKRYQALHEAALDCYQALLTSPENQVSWPILDYLVEVFYHMQVLIELESRIKKSSRGWKTEYKDKLARYIANLDPEARKNISLNELRKKLAADPDLGWLAKHKLLPRLFDNTAN